MSLNVADVMTRDVVTVTPETPLSEAIKIFVDLKFGGLPVVDDRGKLVGVISETDLMWREKGIDPAPYIMFLDSAIYLQNPAKHDRDLHKVLGQTVGEVMTRQGISISPDRTLQAAAKLMYDKHIHRLPVVDSEGQVIGIVTQSDIVRTIAAAA
jgi:CBS domain-containing protein